MVRKPAHLQTERAGRERWLISYTDILTLLLILFVAIAAQAIGEQQARAIESKAPRSVSKLAQAETVPTPEITTSQSSTLAPAASNVTPAGQAPASDVTVPAALAAPAKLGTPAAPSEPVTPAHQALLRAEERLKKTGLDLHLESRGLIISLPQAILFASGDDRINRSAQPLISEIADVIRGLDNKVELAGHADSIPIHNARFKNNWELSAARGLSLLNALTNDYGIAESRLTVSSHGSFSPKSSNDTPDGRAENRRVEILILDSETQQ
ncbi:MAG TPA: OmpA family protein [Bryobacteraceae bacterium]|nr:OmpA family protein [Bryobacteraceae bacterium]